MTRPHSIPWLIILLGAGFAVFTGWSFYRAAVGTSAVTDADYYSHGLRYNQTLLEQRAADSLGWRTSVSYAGGRLLARLTDGNRQPVSSASGTLTLYRTDQPRPQQIPLHEATPGLYQAMLPELTGELTGEVIFERGGARLQHRLLLALPAR